MAITDINFFTFWTSNLPVRRRTARRIARGYVYMRPLQYLRDRFFNQYINQEQGYDVFDPAVQYYSTNQVVYSDDKALYEVLPGLTPPIGTLPTDANYWIQLQPNFVGYKYRQQATAERLKLEYYLNLYFMGAYADPPAQSDIYITTNSTGTNQLFFLVSADDLTSDKAVFSNGQSYAFVGTSDVDSSQYAFDVNISSALYATLGAAPDEVIRAQVDPRNLAGHLYRITVY